MLLADPSLFTAPYDAHLSRGLRAAGVRPVWATRGLRPGEGDAFDPGDEVLRFFYPRTDGARRAPDGVAGRAARLLKGAEHLAGLRRLARLADRREVAAVHFQWSVLPLLDLVAVRHLRRRRPVVLTVHDVEPFNGKRVPAAQRAGFVAVLGAADRLIVHTETGREALAAHGLPPRRLAVVPHGLLGSAPAGPRPARPDRRWTIVQFGKIQAYKGVDVLVEALGRLPDDVRRAFRVVVAGEPLVPLAPLVARADALGLRDVLEWRPGYLDDAGLDALLDEADAFVFPYRAIEASGAFLLAATRGAWMVASDLGAFSRLIGTDGRAGALVPPGDADALAVALARSVGRVPGRRVADAVPGWDAIGAQTAEVYRAAAADWRADRGAA